MVLEGTGPTYRKACTWFMREREGSDFGVCCQSLRNTSILVGEESWDDVGIEREELPAVEGPHGGRGHWPGVSKGLHLQECYLREYKQMLYKLSLLLLLLLA